MKDTPFSYAGLWERVWAFGVDYLAIALYLVVVVVFSLLVNSAFASVVRPLFGNPLAGQMTGFFLVTLPVSLYFALQESSSLQATWGKRWRGLQVIGKNGKRLSRTHALVRTALKFIPWELAHTCIWQVAFSWQPPSPLITAGFVLVWALVGANVISLVMSKTKQTIYDQLARTYVVTANASIQ